MCGEEEEEEGSSFFLSFSDLLPLFCVLCVCFMAKNGVWGL